MADLATLKLGRLKKRSEFLYVRDGQYAARKHIVIQKRANPDDKAGMRAGFTATKKIGNAVTRNRAKRRMRALAKDILAKQGQIGNDYVFIARNTTATALWQELQNDVEKALLRLQ
jgi:ribonuclease P protein component